VLGCAGIGSHCSAKQENRVITVNVPAACPADGGAYATYYGLGDFEPATPQAGHFLTDVGVSLQEVDPRSQEIVASVTEDTEASQSEQTWLGVAPVPASGDVNVLVLPELASCPLSGSVGQRDGSILGPIGRARVMLVGGTGSPTPSTFIADLTTGIVAPLSPGHPDLLTPRTRASLTPFGNGALVAGGVNGGSVLQTAEIYDPALEGFDRQNVAMLSVPRADQGAVVLSTGETLLVGGVGVDGSTVLASMEVVDPSTRIVRAEGVAQLTAPRKNPTVLLLASGEVLVAGGVDAAGAPVHPQLEWFSADASTEEATQDFMTGGAEAFVALEGGGALAVVAAPADQADGSPPFPTVLQIPASRGAPQPASSVEAPLTAPVLFGGAQGAPVLWTGSLWLRWQPWNRQFGALFTLDTLSAQTTIGRSTCSPDPGVAMWLDPSDASQPKLTLLRFDTRNEYSTLPSDLLTTGTSELAPDSLAVQGAVWFNDQSSEGELDLGPGDSAFVTDRTYADVAIDVSMPDQQPALMVLRSTLGDEMEVGGLACPAALGAVPVALHVERHGSAVTWSTPGGPDAGPTSGSCAATFGEGDRISIGVRGAHSGGISAVRDLRVTRLAP
jgi:hypothetical protein